MRHVSGPEPGAIEVLTWSLEMRDAGDVRLEARIADPPLLLEARRPAPELSAFFYGLVGAAPSWTDRAAWTTEQWRGWVDRPQLHLVTAWDNGAPAGYYELEQQADGDVELAYFGLAPEVRGRGLGGWLLARALRHAWRLPGTRRVGVHTCSLDSPAAVHNYESRGMVRFDTVHEWFVD